VRTADSTIIITTNFYLAAGSHEIFLRVGGREGMKGIGAFQRHQLGTPLAKILHPPLWSTPEMLDRTRKYDPKAHEKHTIHGTPKDKSPVSEGEEHRVKNNTKLMNLTNHN